MIAVEKKQSLLAAIEQVEDEAGFERIAAVVAEVLAVAGHRGKAGFMKGSVEYLVENWDAPLPEADWNSFR